MKLLLTTFAILISLILIGCSSSKEMQVGEERIVERSTPELPSWTTSISDEKEGFIYVTGEMTRAKERAFGMTQANADGVQKMLNTMSNRAKQTATQALRGANIEEGDVGRYSEFAVSWISNTYQISGVTTPTTYWEKVEKKNQDGVEYFYNCYVQLKISKADYNKSLVGSFDELKHKAQADNNVKAAEVAQKLLDDLNKQ
jgi:hypothetical protein